MQLKIIKLYIIFSISIQPTCKRESRGKVPNVVDCELVLKEFKLKPHYKIHFQTSTLGKRMNSITPTTSYGLNSITAVLLQGWLWHKMTWEGWYAIKQRNQTNLPTCLPYLTIRHFNLISSMLIEGSGKTRQSTLIIIVQSCNDCCIHCWLYHTDDIN